jgi:single-strand DNA-binding protein
MLNRLEIIGNLGRDPETRHTQAGQKVVNFSVAVTDKRGDKEETVWFDVSVWGRKDGGDGLAGVAEKYCRKGTRVYIAGPMKSRKKEEKTFWGVSAETLILLSGKPEATEAPPKRGELDDEVPF